jgi:hypothetical protein
MSSQTGEPHICYLVSVLRIEFHFPKKSRRGKQHGARPLEDYSLAKYHDNHLTKQRSFFQQIISSSMEAIAAGKQLGLSSQQLIANSIDPSSVIFNDREDTVSNKSIECTLWQLFE